MILQKLYELYDRLETDDSYEVAPEGYSLQKISFIIELNEDGTLNNINDNRIGEGTKKRGREMPVPGGDKPSGGVTSANAIRKALFLRNDVAFALGLNISNQNGIWTAKPAKLEFNAFKKKHAEFAVQISSKKFDRFVRFLEIWNPENHGLDQGQLKCLSEGQGVFKFRSEFDCLHKDPKIEAWWKLQHSGSEVKLKTGRCIVSQKDAPIARLHEPKIKSVIGSQPSGAPLVTFDKGATSYCSYGGDKLQGLNAPTSVEVVTKYCKALNALLGDDRHRFQIGDATVVFWTDKKIDCEASITRFFTKTANSKNGSEVDQAQDRNLLQKIQNNIIAIRKGTKPKNQLEEKANFFILGLTGKAGGRIGVRFWYTGSLDQLLTKIAVHQFDLSLNRPIKNKDKELVGSEYPSVSKLFEQTGRNSKTQKPPAILIHGLMDAILTGANYPQALATLVLNRIRSDRHIDPTIQKDKPLETYRAQEEAHLRTAILKAYLNRNHTMNLKSAIDPTRTEPAYHLGRLFAVYEHAQKNAHDFKLNRTIRETMYASASATPLAVFGRLERLHHHHTAKKSHPYGGNSETTGSYADMIKEIKQHFKGQTPIYPASLNLVGQSLFAVGYYHQLQHFRDLSDQAEEKKKEAKKSETETKQLSNLNQNT